MLSNKKNRNESIDFLRGCACIFILLIHTVWWSGAEYLPKWFSNLFLLFDVPIFMFLAGFSYNYIESVYKNIKGILKQWNKWVFFLIFYVLIMIIFFRAEIHRNDLINYMFYKVPSSGSLKVVGGSLWWIFMYIKVTLFCSIVLYFYNMNKSSIEYKYLLLLMIFLSVVNTFFIDSYVAIYSFIYLLGYKSFKIKLKSYKHFIIYEVLSIILIIIVFYLSRYSLTDLQDLKFPPTIYYLLASMPSLILVWYLKDRIRKSPSNLINYLGKNAIFFFYAQGISSSILFFIGPHISLNIYIKFLIMALININLSIAIGTIINELYNLSYKMLKKIKMKLIVNEIIND